MAADERKIAIEITTRMHAERSTPTLKHLRSKSANWETGRSGTAGIALGRTPALRWDSRVQVAPQIRPEVQSNHFFQSLDTQTLPPLRGLEQLVIDESPSALILEEQI